MYCGDLQSSDRGKGFLGSYLSLHSAYLGPMGRVSQKKNNMVRASSTRFSPDKGRCRLCTSRASAQAVLASESDGSTTSFLLNEYKY